MSKQSLPLILAVETSTEYCSAALYDGETNLHVDEHAGQGHSQMLLPMVNRILSQRRVSVSDLSAVAFGAGPGSFTGLRVACAVAQGLAFGAGIPVIPVNTLLAIAEEAATDLPAIGASGARMLVAQDARMGEVYALMLDRIGETWTPRGETQLLALEQLNRDLDPRVAFGTGNAMRIFAGELADRVDRIVDVDHPSASSIARIALRRFAAGDALDSAQAHPLYVRDRVALTEVERAAGRIQAL